MDGGVRRFSLLSLVAAIAIYITNTDGLFGAWLYVSIELVAIVAIWWAVLARREPLSATWWWLAAGFTLWAGGDAYITLISVHAEEPWISRADVCYVAGGILLLVGVISISSGRRLDRDLDSWIDAAAVLTAGLLVMWQLVISPMLDSPGMPTLARWLAAFYAVVDVALLVLLLRVWLSGARRTAALGWLFLSVAVVTVADVLYSVIAQAGAYSGGVAAMLGVGWFSCICCAAFAATHPSAVEIGRVQAGQQSTAPTVRRLAITGGALLTPVLLPGVRAIRDDTSISFSAGAAGAVLIGLVLARVGRLARASKQWEHTVEAQEAYFRAMAQHSSDAVLVLSRSGHVRDTSPSIEAVVGHPPESILGVDVAELVHPDDLEVGRTSMAEMFRANGTTCTFEGRLRQADDSYRWFEIRLTSLLEDPAVRAVIANLHDVSARKRFEADLKHQAFHDALTGLPNRALFYNRTNHALTRWARRGEEIAVLFCDLDGFKNVNDSLGHAAGDAVLRTISDRLRRITRGEDTVARLGGDEFAVLLEGDHAGHRAHDVALRIVAAVREPLSTEGNEFALGVSIGIASAGTGPRLPSADELVGDADLAMYRAKQSGTDLIEYFAPKMREEARRRLTLESELRTAMSEQQLELHFQPVVTLTTGAIVGFEALVRWRHPTRGLVPPVEFVPFAEGTGLIVPLGGWVVREACRVAGRWPTMPDGTALSIAVNASVRELGEPDYAERVQDALGSAGLAPAQLIIEITETALVDDTVEVAQCLHRLKALGIRIAIDDFGTAYSSFAYLQQFPIDILKIDRAFIEAIRATEAMPRIVLGLFELGRALGLELLAEGIEHDEQIEHLVRAGCDLGQGFAFAEPLDEERTARLAENAQSSWRAAATPRTDN
ncbi:MAG: putative bifunctional diguanylate cyclase/phosphodiesterase [Acidimicrobiia bacterium]